MTPRVFVVDTNVLAAGLITQNVRRRVARIINYMLAGAVVDLLSSALLDEYRAGPLPDRHGALGEP